MIVEFSTRDVLAYQESLVTLLDYNLAPAHLQTLDQAILKRGVTFEPLLEQRLTADLVCNEPYRKSESLPPCVSLKERDARLRRLLDRLHASGRTQ